MREKQPLAKNSKEENSILQLILKYVPYWPLFLLFFLLSSVAAYFYLRYTIPQYEAYAAIIIKDEKKGNDDSKMMESLDLINTKKIIENEIEVLQSRSLMVSVVKKLHLYAPITQEGKVKSLSAYTLAPVIIEAFNPDSIKAVKKVSLYYEEKTGNVILNNTYKGPINKWLNTPYGKLRFLPNDRYSNNSDKKPLYFSILSPNRVAGEIIFGLKVYPSSKLSSVINLF